MDDPDRAKPLCQSSRQFKALPSILRPVFSSASAARLLLLFEIRRAPFRQTDRRRNLLHETFLRGSCAAFPEIKFGDTSGEDYTINRPKKFQPQKISAIAQIKSSGAQTKTRTAIFKPKAMETASWLAPRSGLTIRTAAAANPSAEPMRAKMVERPEKSCGPNCGSKINIGSILAAARSRVTIASLIQDLRTGAFILV